eukprot:5839992-Lingulodinium_polyedra.AAC.1
MRARLDKVSPAASDFFSSELGGLAGLPRGGLPFYTRLLKASKAALVEAKRAVDELARARARKFAADIAGPKGDSAAYR